MRRGKKKNKRDVEEIRKKTKRKKTKKMVKKKHRKRWNKQAVLAEMKAKTKKGDK